MFRVPLATYRLQFNGSFRFPDAQRIAPYLAELGISDLYSSPVLRARTGSTHGYDIVDAWNLNPALGTDDDFAALQQDLRRLGIGYLLDNVPNHMAASAENAWWMSVLENGANSRFLHYFDVDLSPVEVQGAPAKKVLLPILGRPYGETLESQEIRLGFDREGLFFQYYDHRLPLAPESYRIVLRTCLETLPQEEAAMELAELVRSDEPIPNSRFLKDTIWRIYESDAAFRDTLDRTLERLNGAPRDSQSCTALDSLLDAQWYRLAYWRIAGEKINYRRFFDITDLIGIRIENPEVFEARNRKILELVAQGHVTGLRIDHIDGLHDPAAYLKKLQLRIATGTAENPQDSRAENGRAFYVVVEKILAHGESLPRSFPVSGTTGYDFLASVNALFVDPQGLGVLGEIYRSFTGLTVPFATIAYERKKQIIAEIFPGEMRGLGKRLSALAMFDRNARDFAPNELRAALAEVTACLDVYRTYIRDFEISEADRAALRRALDCARKRSEVSLDPRLFNFLERVLFVDPPEYLAHERERWLAFVMRWQQFTGRVMAKGVEDTAFYCYHRLISMNEVGSEPGREGDFDPVKEFHARCTAIARDWPHTLNATSTHDTKRGEDVRARLNVLSEIPAAWGRNVRQWSKRNASLRIDGVPDPNTEFFLYQTLLGIWPLDEEEVAGLPQRLGPYLEKAAREAKTHTSWVAPNHDYERALVGFAEAILHNEAFLAKFRRFQKRIAFYGFLNGLAQVVLKATAPGVPDIYQGTELWDLTLVDPDNRRPVDYERRAAMLSEAKSASPAALLRRWSDGRVKMFTTWKALDVRRRHPDVFAGGAYEAIDAGPGAVAFLRGDSILVIVPRLVSRLVEPGRLPLGDVWGDASVAAEGEWTNAFTGETIRCRGALLLREAFAAFPVAILERTQSRP
ncbi:MAG TPA: malto-oligosyltrehalose synthase [Thermoanaerobaculia bacterium]|nr:malto-oligosyltrehalose synthase [Thermoanaerobaculia bacterium]